MINKKARQMLEQNLYDAWEKVPHVQSVVSHKETAFIMVYLKRLVIKNNKEPVRCELLCYDNRMYIYDAFANKFYTVKQYGRKWALCLEDLGYVRKN